MNSRLDTGDCHQSPPTSSTAKSRARSAGEPGGRQPGEVGDDCGAVVSGDTPLRCAYADPPYPGQSKRHYGDHPDYAGEVDHAELIERLERDFPDGWALSTSVAALPDVLALCPKPEPSKKRAWGGSTKLGTGVRICVWKRTPIPFPPSRVMWSWEPLIVRNPHWRQRHRRDFVPDVFYATQPRGFLGNDITGQKPPEFCGWMFDLLGLGPHDELVDLFPGSGAVSKAWDAWRAQTRLAV